MNTINTYGKYVKNLFIYLFFVLIAVSPASHSETLEPIVYWSSTLGGESSDLAEIWSNMSVRLYNEPAYENCVSMVYSVPIAATCSHIIMRGEYPDPNNTNTYLGQPVQYKVHLAYSGEKIDPFNGTSEPYYQEISDDAYTQAGAGIVIRCPENTSTDAKVNGKDWNYQCNIGVPQPISNSSVCGNPINFLSGDKVQTETDFSGNAGLTLKREYLNQREGWVIDGLSRLTDLTGRYTNTLINDPVVCNGVRATYTLTKPNLDTPDVSDTIKAPYSFCLHYIKKYNESAKVTLRTSEGFSWDLFSQGNYFGTSLLNAQLYPLDPVVSNGAAWVLRYTNNKQEYFDTNGLLIKSIDVNSNVIFYAYNNARLVSKTNRLNETISYIYDAQGNVSSVTLPTGKAITYNYRSAVQNAGNNLSVLDSVVFADNSKQIYEYNDSRFPFALTGAIDANGKRFASWTYDANGLAISSQHAGGADLYKFAYVYGRATVTNPLGKNTTYYYTSINNENW